MPRAHQRPPPDQRVHIRQAESRPLVEAMKTGSESLAGVSAKSAPRRSDPLRIAPPELSLFSQTAASKATRTPSNG